MATNPMTISLSSLTGRKGFRLDGAVASDESGRAVSSAGDVNGDGFDDIIIGASKADTGGFNSGASYVVFGKASGFAANLNLSTLNGSNGFRIDGAAGTSYSGRSVSSAGDVNGDGIDDIIIGAFGADNNASNAGSSFVVFGSTSGFSPTLGLSTLNGTNGFRLDGNSGNDYSGFSVSSAGDVNGDGIDDIIVGAYGVDQSVSVSASGASYVVFGKATGFTSTFNLSSLDGTNGFRIDGVADTDFSGRSVAGVGDFNGDGVDDLIIGAKNADGSASDSGAAYIVYGTAAELTGSISLSGLAGANGFKINGVATGDDAGISVDAAGDINGDGFADVVISASAADNNGQNSSGSTYVVFGSNASFGASFNVSSLNGTNGFRIDGVAGGDESGYSVSSAGDVNGDGFGDLIIGAKGADPNGNYSGASFVVFGAASGFASSINVSTLNGTNGFRINGVAADDRSGISVSSAGDMNGDGFDDLIIGASGADPNGLSSGSSYVLFGRATAAVNRTGTGSDDTYFGGDYNDTLTGLVGNDTLNGGRGNDNLDGGDNDDALNGSSGNDTLLGGLGRDNLKGSSGRDTLTGGEDRDLLTGGTRSDRFEFAAGDTGQSTATLDRILDFEKGIVNTGDRFDFTSVLRIGGSDNPATAIRASIDQTTGVATFDAGSGTTITDAIGDIARRFTLETDSAGEFALFQIGGAGDYHIFVSDGLAGVTTGDVVVELSGITSIGSISLTGGDLTILT